MEDTGLSVDVNRRIAAYMSLKQLDYKKALIYFTKVEEKTDYDLLMMAYAMLMEKNYRDAEAMLFYFYTDNKYIKQTNVSFDKMGIFVSLLKHLNENDELKSFTTGYIKSLEVKLEKADYNNIASMSSILPFQSTCQEVFK